MQLIDQVKSIGFSEYVDVIGNLTNGVSFSSSTEWRHIIRDCLDGGPNRVLRSQPEQEELKEQGAFFTGSKLAGRIATAAVREESPHALYYDPACGAGDLLLAIAQRLPLCESFVDTIENWGLRLAGRDISSDFVRLARYRLALLAAKRLRLNPPLALPKTVDQFPQITVADTINPLYRGPDCDVIVMNPPFTYGGAPSDCKWAKGRVNTAAIYVEKVINDMRSGSQLVALLPEVLRSGSRYVAWRRLVQDTGLVLAERSLGIFDEWTDVDVYFFHFRKETRSTPLIPSRRKETLGQGGIGKRFNVHVGPVVPHRHPELGPCAPYLHARSIDAWTEIEDISEKRKFSGRLFSPPFVVVRRTSRPGCGKRAAATLILGSVPVAVENHMIVCLPKDGSAHTCRELIRRLRSSRTDEWLNKQLRCRHLTTRILLQMPWWNKP